MRAGRKRVEPGLSPVAGRAGFGAGSESSAGLRAKSLLNGLEKEGFGESSSFAFASGASSDCAGEAEGEDATRSKATIKHPGRVRERTGVFPKSDIDQLRDFFSCEGGTSTKSLDKERALPLVLSGIGSGKLKRIGRSCRLFRNRRPFPRTILQHPPQSTAAKRDFNLSSPGPANSLFGFPSGFWWVAELSPQIFHYWNGIRSSFLKHPHSAVPFGLTMPPCRGFGPASTRLGSDMGIGGGVQASKESVNRRSFAEDRLRVGVVLLGNCDVFNGIGPWREIRLDGSWTNFFSSIRAGLERIVMRLFLGMNRALLLGVGLLWSCSALAADQSSRMLTFEDRGQTHFALSLTTSQLEAVPGKAKRVAVVVDTSASQSGTYRSDSLELAERILAGLSDASVVALLGCDIEPSVLGVGAPGSAEIASGIEKLKQTVPLGTTDLVAALSKAREVLGEGNDASILYIGDGFHRCNLLEPKGFESLIRTLRETRTTVNAMAIGPDADVEFLATIANHTGGMVHVHRNIAVLPISRWRCNWRKSAQLPYFGPAMRLGPIRSRWRIPRWSLRCEPTGIRFWLERSRDRQPKVECLCEASSQAKK